MMKMLKDFLREEDGMGTVEIVIIIAVLVAVAIIFRNQIIGFVTTIMNNIFGGKAADLSTSPTAAPLPTSKTP